MIRINIQGPKEEVLEQMRRIRNQGEIRFCSAPYPITSDERNLSVYLDVRMRESEKGTFDEQYRNAFRPFAEQKQG